MIIVPLVVSVALLISCIGFSCGHKPILLLIVLVGLVVLFVHVVWRLFVHVARR